MNAHAEGNCSRQREKTGLHNGSKQLMKAADRQSGEQAWNRSRKSVKGLVMDGVQGCQACSKRLRTILSVPKWQKQMAEIELGSLCYGLPDADAFPVMLLL